MFSNYEGTLQALNERKYFSQMGQIISTMQNKTFLKNRLERNFTFVLLNSGLLPDETQFKTFFFLIILHLYMQNCLIKGFRISFVYNNVFSFC